MKPSSRSLTAAVVALAIVCVAPSGTGGFSLLTSKWNNGNIVMHMQLGGGSGPLIDGSASWNQAVTNTLATWNTHLELVKFQAVQDSTVSLGDGDGVNSVFFSSTQFGRAFGADTLATAYSWSIGSRRVESDVTFNTKWSWNAYTGNQRTGIVDIRRVALHELGHTLGLTHPDENGQTVTALMNSAIGNLDALQADDISGARSLYGSGVTSNVSFPPRNETNDFYSQLEILYRDILRAASVANFVDAEGANVWLTEYARYRVGLCGHSDAVARVFSQIDNTGVYGVCALTPSGAIPFPPRNEGLDFMNQLEVKYRDGLRRGAGSAFVNNEGRVVWILEYLRYRLNRCSHGDAVIRVFQQILGQGIQPVCQ